MSDARGMHAILDLECVSCKMGERWEFCTLVNEKPFLTKCVCQFHSTMQGHLISAHCPVIAGFKLLIINVCARVEIAVVYWGFNTSFESDFIAAYHYYIVWTEPFLYYSFFLFWHGIQTGEYSVSLQLCMDLCSFSVTQWHSKMMHGRMNSCTYIRTSSER